MSSRFMVVQRCDTINACHGELNKNGHELLVPYMTLVLRPSYKKSV